MAAVREIETQVAARKATETKAVETKVSSGFKITVNNPKEVNNINHNVRARARASARARAGRGANMSRVCYDENSIMRPR